MEIFRTAILLLIFCFYKIFCHPSRPLNERSTELAWQAWLLVDDQNQNKQHHDLDNFTRRRITPKSVFIAPTFSPESLPACAEGYRADSMGRCIRIIKLDEEAHLDFLLQKLNAQFGNYDDIDEDSQEEMPTPGPFQLNIPLNGGPSSNIDHSDDNLDIAIVVAPTNGNFAIDDRLKNSAKRTSSENGGSKTLENLPQNEQPIVEEADLKPIIIENRFSSNEKAEKKTSKPATVLPTETPTATTEVLVETTTATALDTPQSTFSTTLTETTTLEVESDTTYSSEHALFFLEHSLVNNMNTKKENVTNTTNEIVDMTTIDPITTTELDQDESTTNTQHTGIIRFPTESAQYVDYIKNPEKITKTHLLPQINRYGSQFNYDETTTLPSTEQFQALFNEYIHSRGDDLKGTERFVFKNHQDRPKHDRFNLGNNVFNHRNRDKNTNLWSFPPSWSESSPHKPIVLRFSRRSNSRHLLEEQINHSQEYYREVPTKDFSFIFGVNPTNSHQRRNHR